MRAVDTNVIVRLLTRDDDAQLAAAERFVAGGAWVSHVVLGEAMWVLRVVYQRDHKQIATSVGMLLEETTVVLEQPDVIESALALYRKSPSIGFTDCLILETARKAGHLPLGTFDKALAKCDGAERL